MLKKVSMVMGVVFLLLGLLGFVPGITTTDSDGMQLLLGVFMVDALHNSIHIVFGLLGLWGAMSNKYAKWYLVGSGVVFALLALVGFFDSGLLGLTKTNMADTWLHLLFAVVLLGAGLGIKGDDGTMAAKRPVM
jgi:hypothetical protein